MPFDQPSLPAPRYTDATITLYCGDAAQIIPLLPCADLLLTDPPYGIGIAARGRVGGGGRAYKRKAWDNAVPPSWLIEMAVSRARQSIVWGGSYLGLGRATCSLVWDKQNDGLKFSQAETAWTNLPSLATRLFRFPQQWAARAKITRIHPTQKPLELIGWCLAKAPAARSVLDPFAGSGTTLIAAMRAGLTCVGIEREEGYCTETVARLKAERRRLQQAGLP